MSSTRRILKFDAFVLDPERRELTRGETAVDIHATPLRLLLYLVEQRGRTVSKRELLDRVWPDTCVGENALTSALSDIRQALGDDGTRQHTIRTERGRGYRFVAAVEEHEIGSEGQGPPDSAVAVLPFEDLSPRGDQAYLADGLTEGLIHALTHVETLQVVARTSVLAFRSRHEDVRCIGAQLGAGTLIEGSVRTSGGRVRITAQLIRVADGFHLWSQRFEGPLDDAFAVEDEVARQVEGAVRSRLGTGTGSEADRGSSPSGPEACGYNRVRGGLGRHPEGPPGRRHEVDPPGDRADHAVPA